MTRIEGRTPLALALLSAVLVAGCGDEEPTMVAEYPDFSGDWQYRSEIRQGAVVCIEHGRLTIDHPGEAPFSGSGTIAMECFEGLGLLALFDDEVPVSGSFGPQTDRGSWPMSFSGRTGWSYAGEGFVAGGGSLVIQGGGEATLDPGNGQPFTSAFDWTICREFSNPSDFVERGCR